MMETTGKEIYCTSCHIYLDEKESSKKHFKSQFHEYNSARISAGLHPITNDEFLKKLKEISEKEEANKKESDESNCLICKKQFQSKIQLTNHTNSKTHKKALLKEENKKNKKNQDNNQSNSKDISKRKTTVENENSCLFCNEESTNMEQNLNHMKTHGFDLPFSKYIKNNSEVIHYLAEKIHIGHVCIGCNNKNTKGFRDGFSLQSHMRDKGHCYVNMDEFKSEYEYFVQNKKDFHDKLSTFKDKIAGVVTYKEIDEYTHKNERVPPQNEQEHSMKDTAEDQKEKVKPNNEEKKITEEDWEIVNQNDSKSLQQSSSFSILDESESSATNLKQTNDYLLLENGELLLTNGNIIGHRDYNYIYKQRVRLEDNRQQVKANKAMAQERMKKMKLMTKKQINFGTIDTNKYIAESIKAQADVKIAQI